MHQQYTRVSSGYTCHIDDFSSAFEMADYLRNQELTGTFEDVREEIPSDSDFYGVKSIDEAYSLLEGGYEPRNLKEIVSKVNDIQLKCERVRTVFSNEVVGFVPNVPLAMMGVPNSMIMSHRIPIKSKIVRIMYDPEIYASLKEKDIQKSALNLIEMICKLEASGYRVELSLLNVFAGNSSAKTIDIASVCIKEASRNLDVKRMLFPLLHRAWFRCIGFRYQDISPRAVYRRARGRAFSSCVTDIERERIFTEVFGDNAFFFNGDDLRNGYEQALERMKK